MSAPLPDPTPAEAAPPGAAQPLDLPAKAGFPRAAVVAIAVAGLFCALTLAFLTHFAVKIQAGPWFVGLNGFATGFMTLGSLWMLWKLLPQAGPPGDGGPKPEGAPRLG